MMLQNAKLPSLRRAARLLAGASLLPLMACDTSYTPDDPDAAMRKESMDAISCGDGVLWEFNGEVCDGDDLGGATCESEGLPSGTLGCNSLCTAFDTSRCVGEDLCGNGILEAGEACEPVDGEECEYDDTECQICSTTCEFEPGTPRFCGDGALQRSDEACDGEAFGGATCASSGFGSGTLACNESCELDTSECVPAEDVAEGDDVSDAGSPGEDASAPTDTDDEDVTPPTDIIPTDTDDEDVTPPTDTSARDTSDARAPDANDEDVPNASDAGARDASDAGTPDTVSETPRPPEDESGCAASTAAPGFAWMLIGLLGLRNRPRPRRGPAP